MNTNPRTWICKATNSKANAISTPYISQINAGVAGFNLADINPAKFADEKELQSNIRVGKPKAGMLTGRTFGKQAWAISHEAKPGDRIFLECADAGPKPKGTNRHSTFIVAAGTVTGPYSYNAAAASSTGLHTIGVSWEWRGKQLIDYGHFMFCFVEIHAGKRTHADLLAALNSIWETSPKGEPRSSEQPIVDADKSLAMSFDPDWREGGLKMRHHMTIERCSRVAAEAKNMARQKTGKIACLCCGDVTAEIYGHEVVEAHHIVPLASTKGMERKPRVDDFVMLCPNCHRAVHRLINKEKLDGREALDEVRSRARKR